MASFENHEISKEMLSGLIVRAIQGLPEMDREIFILKHYKNCSDHEIALRLSLTPRQVEASLKKSSIALLCSLNPLKKHLV